ncbi:hypothetical protein V8G54_007345 [Vigna mungo]|uniref:Transmembrane protein n=1 Tax=Vigna mungo TaxID=3915 RepID=A0AAQ3P255_VIGMU
MNSGVISFLEGQSENNKDFLPLLLPPHSRSCASNFHGCILVLLNWECVKLEGGFPCTLQLGFWLGGGGWRFIVVLWMLFEVIAVGAWRTLNLAIWRRGTCYWLCNSVEDKDVMALSQRARDDGRTWSEGSRDNVHGSARLAIWVVRTELSALRGLRFVALVVAIFAPMRMMMVEARDDDFTNWFSLFMFLRFCALIDKEDDGVVAVEARDSATALAVKVVGHGDYLRH